MGNEVKACELPNQTATWAGLSGAVEEFSAWRQRTNRRYDSEDTELLCYLSDQLKVEGAALVGGSMNHPVLGLLSYMSESNNRMQELLLAYLSLAVARDSGLAQKLIAGQRLHVGLDPSYVAATRCYGVQETETPEPQGGTDAAVAAIQFALDDEDGMLFLRYWNEGEFDVIRSEWPDAPEDVFIGADPLYVPG